MKKCATSPPARVARVYEASVGCGRAALAKGLTATHFARFARAADVLELARLSKPELDILFIKLCAAQPWEADQPAQKLMRATTFAQVRIMEWNGVELNGIEY